jgi:hypothetical protein
MVEKIRPTNSWANVTSTEAVKKLKRRKESKDLQQFQRDRRRKKKPTEAQADRSDPEPAAAVEEENRPDASGGTDDHKSLRGRKIDIRV